MCLLFESIKVKNNTFYNLEAHVKRMNSSILNLWGINKQFSIHQINLPTDLSNALYKCRIIYNKHIQSIDFEIYNLRVIKKLKLIEDNDITYSLKYLDRNRFTKFFSEFPDYDEFIIIKNGLITDSTFSNLIFFDGQEWHTPKSFLLPGTKRSLLLEQNLIKEVNLSVNTLFHYQSVSFINAMLDPGDIQLSLDSLDLEGFR